MLNIGNVPGSWGLELGSGGSRMFVMVTAIIAVTIVFLVAMDHGNKGVAIAISPDGGLTLTVQENQDSLASILAEGLDTNEPRRRRETLAVVAGALTDALSAQPADDPRPTLAVLETAGLYHIDSPRIIDAIERRSSSDPSLDLARELRALLHDLRGPFARPHTFQDFEDDRLLEAFDDLVRTLDKGGKVSPLLSGIWRMSLDLEGPFKPRPLRARLTPRSGLRSDRGAVCVGSVLLDKRAQIVVSTERDMRAIDVLLDTEWPCPNASARALLGGEPAEIYLAEGDFRQLLGLDVDDPMSAPFMADIHVFSRIFTVATEAQD